MDGTNNSDGLMNTDTMSRSRLTSGIGLAIGIVLLIIITLTLVSYFCTRSRSSSPRQTQELQELPQHQPSVADKEVGLDEATLFSYPTLLYSHAKIQNKDTASSCCSICLTDYKDTDMLRLLPDCSHIFHVKCVDDWLRLHPTCPVCRTSPLPITPLTEVVLV